MGALAQACGLVVWWLHVWVGRWHDGTMCRQLGRTVIRSRRFGCSVGVCLGRFWGTVDGHRSPPPADCAQDVSDQVRLLAAGVTDGDAKPRIEFLATFVSLPDTEERLRFLQAGHWDVFKWWDLATSCSRPWRSWTATRCGGRFASPISCAGCHSVHFEHSLRFRKCTFSFIAEETGESSVVWANSPGLWASAQAACAASLVALLVARSVGEGGGGWRVQAGEQGVRPFLFHHCLSLECSHLQTMTLLGCMC